MSIRTASDLRASAKKAGSPFFDRKTMKFFNSKIHSVYEVPGGAVFITSEKYPHSPRHFRVRFWDESEGDAETLAGGSSDISSLARARDIARAEAKKRR